MQDTAKTGKWHGTYYGDAPRANAGGAIWARHASGSETADRALGANAYDAASDSSAVTGTAGSGAASKPCGNPPHSIAAHRLTTIKQGGRIRIV